MSDYVKILIRITKKQKEWFKDHKIKMAKYIRNKIQDDIDRGVFR